MKTRIFIAILSVTVLFTTSCKKEDAEANLEAFFAANQINAHDCSELGTAVSLNNTPTLNLRFENRASSDIKIQWINFNGELVTYEEALAPGDDYPVQSFLWHYWYITDADGDCVGIYRPKDLSATNVITFEDK
ncbi:MAG: hypothetical protein ACPGU4_02815 [Flavobacteriales bacterium]